MILFFYGVPQVISLLIKPRTLDKLNEAIRQEITQINSDLLEKSGG